MAGVSELIARRGQFCPRPGTIRRMINLVKEKKEAIAALCRKYGVKRLEVFGSAARGDFEMGCSDVDFFYEFEHSTESGLVDRFFGLLWDLESLLGTKVDLVSAEYAKNPYFLEVANRYRTTLYAA